MFALRNREMSAGAVGFSISYARMSPFLPYKSDEGGADDSFVY